MSFTTKQFKLLTWSRLECNWEANSKCMELYGNLNQTSSIDKLTWRIVAKINQRLNCRACDDSEMRTACSFLMPMYLIPSACAAPATSTTGIPTTPNIYSTPWVFKAQARREAPFRATPSTSSSLAAAILKSAIQYVSPYTEWVSFRKMRKKIRNAGIGTAKQSVFLRIHIRANSQTKGLERGWKRRARLFSCFFLARLSLFLAPRESGPLNWERANTKIKREKTFRVPFTLASSPLSERLEQATPGSTTPPLSLLREDRESGRNPAHHLTSTA